MRNLKLLHHREIDVHHSGVGSIRLDGIKANTCYGITDAALVVIETEPLESREYDLAFLPSPVTQFEYLALNDEFCIAHDNVVSLFNPNRSDGAVDNVCFCDGDVQAMEWSPDQEAVVIVTKLNKCLLMNSVFDVLVDVNLMEVGASDFMNVGWGKKETQFHGSQGKGAAMEAIVTGVDITDCHQLDARVCWRGDGKYFVVSFIADAATQRRAFKVFDNEGQLLFVSEKCHGLDGALAWRPSGLWIAIPQLLENDDYVIALFERNGLRHRELMLPFKRSEEVVMDLCWSADSECLVVQTSRPLAGVCTLYLYTINNYHWYLKQVLNFDAQIKQIRWDQNPTEGKQLHVFLASGIYHILRWTYEVCSSYGCTTEDETIVGVIDGNDALFTNFRSVVIPPPMSAFKLSDVKETVSSKRINTLCFLRYPAEEGDSNRFFVVTENNTIRTYRCVFATSKGLTTRKLEALTPTNEYQLDVKRFENHHWTWLTDNVIVFSNGNRVKILNGDEMAFETNAIITGINAVSERAIIVSLFDNRVQKIEINVTARTFGSATSLFALPSQCEGHVTFETAKDEIKVFSLKPREMLYLNGCQYLHDITSMHRIGPYLAVTTVEELKFINVTASDMPISDRKIERGGLLVAIVPDDSRTILQMPRGNLEALRPRTLSLVIVARLLDNCEYVKCYDILRRERINLNIIVDHDPAKFFANMDVFVKQIDNAQWLNLFLTELHNSDITQTTYKQYYADRPNNEQVIVPSSVHDGYSVERKIDYVCKQFCCIIENFANASTRYLLPKITSFVKRNDLESALQVVWDLRQSENNVSNDESLTAEEALTYLLYLVDVNDLFNVALGMYDFDAVLFVARRSQKDPKEYLPFLNELKLMTDTYRKYKIDLHLKKYGKALENIIECGQTHFEECLQLVKEHALYREALRSLDVNDGRYKIMAGNYANYLREKGKLSEASFMYERSGDLEQALSCARNILNWERCLKLKRALSSDVNETKSFARSLIPAMTEKRLYAEAAHICESILGDPEKQLDVLLEGKLFLAAIYVPNADHSKVRTEFQSYHGTLLANLEEDGNLFCKQRDRLLQLRKQKIEEKLNRHEDQLDMDSDLFSDTTSVNSSQFTGSSRGTGKTFRSSKNRRKHERKLLNLKEGNTFEDIALIDSLHNLALKILSVQGHVKDTNQAAIELGMIVLGVEVQRVYKSILERVKNSLDVIWIPEMIVSDQISLGEDFDLKQVQSDQHYALIKTHQRFKPSFMVTEWEFEMLK